MKWYLMAFQKYGVFNGRSRRKEYWTFVLFNIFIGVILYYIERFYFCFPRVIGLGPYQRIYYIITLLPTLSLSVRRLHDTNRSGLWVFINFVPLVGGFWFFWLMLLDSDHFTNRYGDDPTALPEEEAL